MKRVNLTEQDLHRLINEAINEALDEMEKFEYTADDYRDAGSTSNVKEFNALEHVYQYLKQWLNSINHYGDKKEWTILQDNEWESLIKMARNVAERFVFKNKYDNNNLSEEDWGMIQNFGNRVSKIGFPDMPLRSSFVEKAQNIIKSLNGYYHEYSDIIDYFISKHDDYSMKQLDMKADWNKFDSTVNKRTEGQHLNANYTQALRTVTDPFGYSNKRGALDRYDSVIENDDEWNENLLKNRYLGK